MKSARGVKFLKVKLDINSFSDDVKCISLGKIEPKMVDFIIERAPQLASMLNADTEIIHNPDYLSIHPKDNSISFIKDFSAHVSVAVRVSVMKSEDGTGSRHTHWVFKEM